MPVAESTLTEICKFPGVSAATLVEINAVIICINKFIVCLIPERVMFRIVSNPGYVSAIAEHCSVDAVDCRLVIRLALYGYKCCHIPSCMAVASVQIFLYLFI